MSGEIIKLERQDDVFTLTMNAGRIVGTQRSCAPTLKR